MNNFPQNKHPHLELIVGTMYSQKTSRLISSIKRYKLAKLETQVFKPEIDDRYDKNKVASHDGHTIDAYTVSGLDELRSLYNPQTSIIGIDEVQFLEDEVIDFCDNLVRDGKIVVVAGLLKDFKDEYFKFKGGSKDMSDLMRIADEVTYLNALCTYEDDNGICWRPATRAQRLTVDGKVAPVDSGLVAVGGNELDEKKPEEEKFTYAARCRQHFQFYK